MLRRLTWTLSLFVLFTLVAAPLRAAAPKEITVSAAISLKNAFDEIGKKFEASPGGVKVVFNYGASGDLMAQIKGGAPVDVFASAALKDLDELAGQGLLLPDTKAIFAGNEVVLVMPAAGKVKVASFEDLASAGVKKIAVGNPKTVPAGRYAEEVFGYFKISEKLKDKLVFGENVRQVLEYVARGEVDAGIVYLTDAMTKKGEVKVVATAPEASHKPVAYPIAVVKASKETAAAKAFIAFVRSKEGEAILDRCGFKPAPK